MTETFTVIEDWLNSLTPVAAAAAGLGTLLLAAIVAHLVVKYVVMRIVRRATRSSKTEWDDALVEHHVLDRLFHIVPALLVYLGARWLLHLDELLLQIVSNVSLAYIALMVTLAIAAFLRAVNDIYSRLPVSRERPIKGFIQIAIIAAYVIGGVIVVATLIDKSPLVLLTGFGAMTAIVLLIFRDTILSLVASIQLTSMDMIRIGDWIEMPMYNADGDVIDVALHTIKVQNWDKTITTIPTHKLISESFKNWRGMEQSGGRRIKRSIGIDVESVRFLEDDEVERFSRFALLSDYIADKQRELNEYNDGLADTANVNLRRLTNLGTFRAYLVSYLRRHPRVHQDMTLIVRQLQPSDKGIPIEIYCFTNTTEWVAYEAIQADIFDHILAQAHEFGLGVFQGPSGADVRALAAEADDIAVPEDTEEPARDSV
ncbi:MAG: mechanosensitive ion channel domain-containing protein [Pseudomonadota bacterium]